MKAKKCKAPFSKYHGYKQTLPNGRTYVYLWNRKTDKRKLISLARYRMSVKLGRFLTESEEVDHRDDDFTNDRLSNLKLVSRTENQRKEQLRRRGFLQNQEIQSCEACGKKFKHVRPRKTCGKVQCVVEVRNRSR